MSPRGNFGSVNNNMCKGCEYVVYVTVTGRNQTLFLSIFDHCFDDLSECSKLAYSNSYICAVSTPTLGLYVQSIALGELIDN